MFNLHPPSKYSPFDTIHLWRLFPTAQNNFWTCPIWCLLGLLLFFGLPLPHQQNISIWGLLFIKEKKNRVAWGKIWLIGKMGDRSHDIFGQKLLNTQPNVGRCTCKLPIMKGASTLNESSKTKFTETRTQPLTTTPAGALIQMGS